MDHPYRTVRDLIHRHAGRPAVVLGGGPSLPAELAGCQAQDPVLISANDHGARLVECDYLVALDRIEDRLRPFGKPIVSRHMWADYRFFKAPAASTGVAAAWVARLMGCAPIYTAGMDCFEGGTYFHDQGAHSNGKMVGLQMHLDRWREALEKYPADYRPLGGPLAAAMPAWCCRIQGPAPRARIARESAGVFVRFLRDAPVRGRRFQSGTHAELRPKEAGELMRKGQASRLI